MKIESCPNCGKEPIITRPFLEIISIPKWWVECTTDECLLFETGRTKLGAILNWNRRARRLRRRMKKEADA